MNVLSTLIRDNLKRSVKFLAYEARRMKVLVSEGIKQEQPSVAAFTYPTTKSTVYAFFLCSALGRSAPHKATGVHECSKCAATGNQVSGISAWFWLS